MSKLTFTYDMFNPLFYHLRSAMRNEDVRIVLNIGGSSSGKSYSSAQVAIYTVLEQGCNILVLRKIGSSISRSIYMDFKTVIRSDEELARMFDCFQNEIRCKLNGAIISFSGLDDSEKIKGISQYKYLILDELTEFEYEDFKQLRKRMRGIRGQQMICNFNPISELHWIKTKVIDAENWEELPRYVGRLGTELCRLSKITSKHKNSSREIINPRTGAKEQHPSDMLLLKTTYLNNYWVVGSPDGDFGLYDRQTVADFEKDKERDFDYYRIYALADWGVIRTGGEFLYNFDEKRNSGMVGYNALLPIHLSVDNNVLPYISVGVWQLEEKKLFQIHEIAAEEPNNTVTKAGDLVVNYLKDLAYNDIVIVHADASTSARNTIDDQKLSFIDKFCDVLSKAGYKVNLSIPKKNPSVSMSCEFVNKLLFDGRILVNRDCKKSLLDYLNSKRDANGGMMKKRIRDKETGQSYEQWGHFTDTLRYVAVDTFLSEYTNFSATRVRNPIQENDYKFYDILPEGEGYNYVEIYPNINGSMVMIKSVFKKDKIYVTDILLTEPYKSGMFKTIDVKGEVCVIMNPSTLKVVKEIRKDTEHLNVFVKGRRDKGRHAEKADSYIPYIKENVYLHKDIKEEVINNILDYNGASSFEVVTAMATMCERIIGENRA